MSQYTPESRDATDQKDDGKPNAVVNAMSNAMAAIRADDDQLDLAKAHERLGPKLLKS